MTTFRHNSQMFTAIIIAHSTRSLPIKNRKGKWILITQLRESLQQHCVIWQCSPSLNELENKKSFAKNCQCRLDLFYVSRFKKNSKKNCALALRWIRVYAQASSSAPLTTIITTQLFLLRSVGTDATSSSSSPVLLVLHTWNPTLYNWKYSLVDFSMICCCRDIYMLIRDIERAVVTLNGT